MTGLTSTHTQTKTTRKSRYGSISNEHYERVRNELRAVGVSSIAMSSEECISLPELIHSDEHIGGVVYGFHHDGFAMLVATDQRVLFYDKKPLFDNMDDIKYGVVSGVSFGHAGIGSTVTLHTKIKDYKLRTFNQKCALNFTRYIETRCLMNNGS